MTALLKSEISMAIGLPFQRWLLQLCVFLPQFLDGPTLLLDLLLLLPMHDRAQLFDLLAQSLTACVLLARTAAAAIASIASIASEPA
jgi:hypothetical protein